MTVEIHGFQRKVSYKALATCFPVTELVKFAFVVSHFPLGYFRIIRKERPQKGKGRRKTQMQTALL